MYILLTAWKKEGVEGVSRLTLITYIIMELPTPPPVFSVENRLKQAKVHGKRQF